MAAIRALSGTGRAPAALRPWMRHLAHAGLFARGLVYLTVGWLAARRALGEGGQVTDADGAIRHMGRGSLGDVLLALVAAGLVAYGVWRLVQAVHDTEGAGSDAKGLGKRAVYLGKGLLHLLLAVTPIRLLAEGRAGNGGDVRSWAGRVLAHEWGGALVAAAGVAVIGAGLYQVWKGWKASFIEHLALSEMSARVRTWATRAGTFGYTARGVTLGLVGVFLVQAAREADPGRAGGLREALRTLLRQPQGPWLLGVVAFGLVAYGLYSLVEARYRRVRA